MRTLKQYTNRKAPRIKDEAVQWNREMLQLNNKTCTGYQRFCREDCDDFAQYTIDL
jgi:hypothetical protein